MRILYLDESGVGSLHNDPNLVIAGVLIHADKQWHEIAGCLRSLLEAATPAGVPLPSCIHTKDVFHGSGEFRRDVWAEDVRHGLLDEVAKLPVRFKTPVVWGFVDRAKYAELHPNDTPLQHKMDNYAEVALPCFMQVEWYMRNVIGGKEVASIILESNKELQKRVG